MSMFLGTSSESKNISKSILISFFIYLLLVSVYASFVFLNAYFFHKEALLNIVGFGLGYRAVLAPFFLISIMPNLIGSPVFLTSLAFHLFCFIAVYIFVRVVHTRSLFSRYKIFFLILSILLLSFSVLSGVFEFLQLRERSSAVDVRNQNLDLRFRSSDVGVDTIQQRFVYRGFQNSGKPTAIFVGDFYGQQKKLIQEIPERYPLDLVSPGASFFITSNAVNQDHSVVRTSDLSEVKNLCEKIFYKTTTSESEYNTNACYAHNCAWSSNERFLACFGGYSQTTGNMITRDNGRQESENEYHSILRVFDMISGDKFDVFSRSIKEGNSKFDVAFSKEGRIFWSEDENMLRFLWNGDVFEIFGVNHATEQHDIMGKDIQVPYFQKVGNNALIVNDKTYYKVDSTNVPAGLVGTIANPVEKYKTQDLKYFVIERGFKKDDQYKIINRDPLPSFESLEYIDAKRLFLRGDQNMILNIENGSVFILDHYKEDEKKYLFVSQAGKAGGQYFYLSPLVYSSSK